jgi:isopentenyl-diphosphate delta-isomerase
MPTSSKRRATVSRKKQHVELVLAKDVAFRLKSTGLESVEFVHNALPELDLEDIRTDATFLGKSIALPLLVSSMTGGYPQALRINRELASACEEIRIPMGVGSQRQALEDSSYHRTFSVVRETAPSIPIVGNLGAAEVARLKSADPVKRLAELIGADGFCVHLNPLQELLQPEGTPKFKGVLAGIEMLVRDLPLPILVKEIGAGISAEVARRLLEVGVRHIDIAGAGGTSWAGVEILRGKHQKMHNQWWDWGIPTAEAIRAVAALKAEQGQFTLIASGGISSGLDIARAIALGADIAASARPVLKTLRKAGPRGVLSMLRAWEHDLRSVMFLTGSGTVQLLQSARILERKRP